MAAIEPGDRFTVEYGNQKRVEVIALGLRGQRKLAALVRDLINAEENAKGLELFDMAEESLRMVIPDVSDELLDSLDAEMAIEIATKTLGKQSLSEDDLKKSESQP